MSKNEHIIEVRSPFPLMQKDNTKATEFCNSASRFLGNCLLIANEKKIKVYSNSILLGSGFYYASRIKGINKGNVEWEWQLFRELAPEEGMYDVLRDVKAYISPLAKGKKLPRKFNIFVTDTEEWQDIANDLNDTNLPYVHENISGNVFILRKSL